MEPLSPKHFEPMPLPKNVEIHPPMIVCQTLDGAIDEFIAAVKKLRNEFPQMSSDKITEVVLELRRLAGPHKV